MSTESGGILARVVDWLRAGYPEGVPRTDVPPLLAVLSRRLTPEEVDSIAADLAAAADDPTEVGADDIRALISEHLLEDARPEDVARVSARLAGGGWPLGRLSDDSATDSAANDGVNGSTPRSRPVGRIVAWLREGYPQGVPAQDYFPLLALLRRRLTDEEVKAVAKSLRRADVSPVGPADIGVEITKLTNEMPAEADLERVRARLAKKGWPLDFPERSNQT
jgi:hypothetical protein